MFAFVRLSLALAGLVLLAAPSFGAPQHPLDALHSEEYVAVEAVLSKAGKLSEGVAFALIQLDEPPKAKVLAWKPGDTFPRVAFVVLRDGARMFEARVDLVAGALVEHREVAGQQSSILFSEWTSAQQITMSDPGWLGAMQERGYEKPSPEKFLCLPLSAGYFAIPEFAGRRLLRVQCFDLKGTTGNPYQRPIENLTAVVDVVAKEVVKLIDEGRVPVANPSGNYDEAALQPYQPAMKPLVVTQPQGPSFTIDGSVVRWGQWQFHLRVDRRRGPVVSLATFAERSVLYQASLSEMWVPYMDPAEGWYYKTYFDAGEYGFGMFGTPLTAGVDCPQHAKFIDHAIAFDDAKPVPYPRVLCLFERPTMGPAWRHAELTNQSFNGRPGRELVARMIAAVGNYDYVFDYVFMPTGAVRVSIASTGIDITKGVGTAHMSEPNALRDTRFGTLIAPNLVGVYHDHYFSLRFDLDVDGQKNRFVRDRIVPTRLANGHPRRSIWTVKRQRAFTERDAMLDIDLKAPEQWRVESTSRKNGLGNPTSYVLTPSGNAYTQLSDYDYPQSRAGFTRHHLWVTPYDPGELYAAGDYPNQSKGEGGLPTWTARNRLINGRDLVLWYTLGFHHITSSEDWPVLPSHPKTVTLRPFNFFDRSQVMSMAPAASAKQ